MTILSLLQGEAPQGGQKYLQLEKLFRKAIDEGVLAPGEKLPPLREAAWQARCSLGTMSRVYTALERQGLVVAEVGRGTFVAEPGSQDANVILPAASQSVGERSPAAGRSIDLAMNAITNRGGEELVRWALHRVADKAPSQALMQYRDGKGEEETLLGLRRFLPTELQGRGSDQILITHGVQNCLFTIFNRLASRGDGVAVEPLSYPGVAAAISQNSLTPHAVETDEHGICPNAFAKLCRGGRIRLLITMATGHNPSGRTTPLERRRELGEIAEAHGVLIVEDGIYDFLYPEAPPSYAALFPKNALYLTGLGKRIAPSLRLGLVVAPPALTTLLAQGITAQSWMVSPLITQAAAEIAARQESLQELQQTAIAESVERRALTRDLLAAVSPGLQCCRSHAWMKVPDSYSVSEFVEAAQQAGVSVTPGFRFANRPGAAEGMIRLSIMAPASKEELKDALQRLLSLCKEEAHSSPLLVV